MVQYLWIIEINTYSEEVRKTFSRNIIYLNWFLLPFVIYHIPSLNFRHLCCWDWDKIIKHKIQGNIVSPWNFRYNWKSAKAILFSSFEFHVCPVQVDICSSLHTQRMISMILTNNTIFTYIWTTYIVQMEMLVRFSISWYNMSCSYVYKLETLSQM